MIVSIKEEAQPEMQPYVMPITVAMKLLAMPIRSEVLPPFQSTEKNIAAQRIRAKPKFFVRRFIQVGKIELCGIVVDKQMGEKTGENDSA